MSIKKVLSFIGIVILLSGCATTKLMDSWKAKDFNNLSSAKILVISQTPETDVRKSYEIAIANKLRAKKVDAIESHILFPSLKAANTQEEQEQVVKNFKEAGITAIILTSLKQTIETTNGSMAAQTSIPDAYEDKKSFGPNVIDNESTVVSTSKTYILEGLIYDLTLERNEQLVNVCLVDATDPDSPDKIQKAFTKIIADQFK